MALVFFPPVLAVAKAHDQDREVAVQVSSEHFDSREAERRSVGSFDGLVAKKFHVHR